MYNGRLDVQKNNIFDAQCLVRELHILFGKPPHLWSPVVLTQQGWAGMGREVGLPCHLTWLLGRDLGLATQCPVTGTLPIVGPMKVNPQTSE